MLCSYGQLPHLSCFDPVGVTVETPQVYKVGVENVLKRSLSLFPTKMEELPQFSKEPSYINQWKFALALISKIPLDQKLYCGASTYDHNPFQKIDVTRNGRKSKHHFP